MDISILTPDGATRVGVLVADLATAQALHPGMLCVERGTGADLTAADPQFDDPQPQTTQTVTPRQMRLALNRAGLRAVVEAAVASAPQDVKDSWEYSTLIERDNPVLVSMAATLGISAIEIDDLFALAASL